LHNGDFRLLAAKYINAANLGDQAIFTPQLRQNALCKIFAINRG